MHAVGQQGRKKAKTRIGERGWRWGVFNTADCKGTRLQHQGKAGVGPLLLFVARIVPRQANTRRCACMIPLQNTDVGLPPHCIIKFGVGARFVLIK